MENFLLFIIIAASFYGKNKNIVFLVAFLAGLFLDFWTGNLIGRTSLSFLIIAFLAVIYSKKYSSSHFIFQAVYTFFAVWLLNFLRGGLWSLSRGFFWALFSIVGLFLIKKIWNKQELKLEI